MSSSTYDPKAPDPPAWPIACALIVTLVLVLLSII
jgi:hypothetical protein